MSLPLVETFLSFQGEGPRAGRLSTFVRFGGCNLSCGYQGGWKCDSPYTWDARNYDLRQQITPVSVMDILAMVDGEADDVVLTGGEPLMHQKNPDWGMFLRQLTLKDKYVCVETNGTIAPNPTTQTFVQHYSISPKLANTTHKPGQSPEMAEWPAHLKTNHTALKFVVTNAADVKEAVSLSDSYGWPRWNVWMMPEGTDTARLQESFGAIAQESIDQRVNVCHRLQILAFGDKRGT
jgi:7-carboxy-7-deazaguanine synthase